MTTTETNEVKEPAIAERARNKTWHCRLPSEIFLTLTTYEGKPQELSVDAAAALIAGLKLYTDDKRAKFLQKVTYRPSWILRLAAVETGLLTDRRLDALLTDPAGAVRRAAARELTKRGVDFDADAVKDFLARGIRPPVVVRLGEDAEEPDAATRKRREKEAKEWETSGDVIGELRIGSEKTVLRPADFDWATLNFIPPEEHFQGGDLAEEIARAFWLKNDEDPEGLRWYASRPDICWTGAMAVVRSGDEKAQLAAVKNPAFWRRLEVKDAAEFAGGDAGRVAACLEATEDPQTLTKLARRFMKSVDPEIRLLAEGVVDGVFVPELVMIREKQS